MDKPATAQPIVTPPAFLDNTSEFLLAEYAALRQEILKRMEIQHQLVSITLTAFGALATIGLSSSVPALQAYPIVTLFLTAAWSQNDIRIGQLGHYIREEIEEKFLDSKQGWEHSHVASKAGLLVGARSMLAARGIFVGTQLVMLLLVTLRMLPSSTVQDLVLLVVDIIFTGFTLLLLREYKITKETVVESTTST